MPTTTPTFSWPADFATRIRLAFGDNETVNACLAADNQPSPLMYMMEASVQSIKAQQVLDALDAGGNKLEELRDLAERIVEQEQLYREAGRLINDFRQRHGV